MLKNTFLHIPTIGKSTEKRIWESGLHDWDSFLSADKSPFSELRKESINDFIRISITELSNNNPEYFYKYIPKRESWRLFADFRQDTCYLDIETTGLQEDLNHITTIALYDGINIKYYIHGKNLENFTDDILKYKVAVTFNGHYFDIPFIQKYFNIKLNLAHIDLRFILKSLGYTGGLKNCEKQFGLDREELDGINGYFAVLLWQEYLNQNNEKALQTLLAYNILDVINLEQLMIKAYNKRIEEMNHFPMNIIPATPLPELPIKPDLDLIKNLKEKYYWRLTT